MLALMGPSGSGKTTLLMVLGCLLRPTQGEVWVQGQALSRLTERERSYLRLARMGFIFQSYNLFPALTALENVTLSAVLKGTTSQEARDLLEAVGLGERLHALPAKLSGGEKQRVAIARALTGAPAILLADEPTAALDTRNGLAVVALLRDIAHQRERAVVVVTHDPRVAAQADRRITLEDGKLLP
jgi:putative ABC transport system ATP-binding protein